MKIAFIRHNNVAAISKKAWKRDRLQRGSKMEPRLKGYVRSVQGVLRGHLAKIYGNLDPQQIVVEGCSRTDKGVHARSMMAMIYGLHNDPLGRHICKGGGRVDWGIIGWKELGR